MRRLGKARGTGDKGNVENLPVFMLLKGRPVIVLGEGAAAAAKARLLARAGAVIMRDESADARLAIVALENADAAEAAVSRLRARRILVNAVDRPHLCDFTLPAIVDRSPVLVAIGTGGASASLAKALRQWLERMLPSGLGRTADALKVARPQLAQRFADPGARRAFLDKMLAPGGVLDPLMPMDAPDALIAQALSGAVDEITSVCDHVILSSTDPDDLTLRTARLLAAADVVFHQPDVPADIVNRARADATRIEVDQLPEALPDGRVVFLRMAG